MRAKSSASVVALLLALGALVATKHVSLTPSSASSQAAPQEPLNLIALRFVLGIKDQEPQDWDGSIKLDSGQVVQLKGWRFQQTDKVLSETSWKCSTRKAVFVNPLGRLPEPGERVEPSMIPNGIIVTLAAPETANVEVATKQGSFSFRLSEVGFEKPLEFLGGSVTVERVLPTKLLTGTTYEDDYPSMAIAKDGTVWLAWIAYRGAKDEVLVRRLTSSGWSEPVKVTEQPGDNFRTAIAEDGRGRIWVVWSGRTGANWDLYARSFDGKSWSQVERLTTDPGPDIFHEMVADGRGRLWLVWQGFRQGQSDIFLKYLSEGKWSKEVRVSDSSANDWDPSVAANSRGKIWIAWDSYAHGNYDIFLRSFQDNKLGQIIQVTRSPRFQAHADVACDNEDRVWIAWDESGVNWGKDWTHFDMDRSTTLYKDRSINIACLVDGKLQQPASDVMVAVPPILRRYVQLPHLRPDSRGRIWLFLRIRTSALNIRNDIWSNGGRWEILLTAYEGDSWRPLVYVPDSVGRNDARVASAQDAAGNLWAAWASDERPFRTPMGFGEAYAANYNVYYTAFKTPKTTAQAPALKPFAEPNVSVPVVHKNEKQDLERIRNYSVTIKGKTYKIYRGDLHRHTDISADGAGDGSLWDLQRYALDAAQLDFSHVGDHNMGGDQEYHWWRTEKCLDLFFLPGRLVTLFGYERSVAYPNGHRNVVFAQRGVRTLPVSREENRAEINSGSVLYPYLRKHKGIAMAHSLATDQGTDWRDNDPELEPLVELYQGYHVSYEYEGAPLAETRDKHIIVHGPFRPAGFYWEALRKGYKLGVQASSDHISTHISYACVYADSFTREGLLDAMRKRHTYAATDNIILDFRMQDESTGEHMMGDIFATKTVPKIVVKAIGTANIKQIDVIKNNAFILTRNPGKAEDSFTYVDNSISAGESYYYVRVWQEDNQIAWSSPIWVTYNP